MTQYNSQSHAMPHSLHSKINKRGFCYFRFLHVFPFSFRIFYQYSICLFQCKRRKVVWNNFETFETSETPCKLDQIEKKFFTMFQAYYLLYTRQKYLLQITITCKCTQAIYIAAITRKKTNLFSTQNDVIHTTSKMNIYLISCFPWKKSLKKIIFESILFQMMRSMCINRHKQHFSCFVLYHWIVIPLIFS